MAAPASRHLQLQRFGTTVSPTNAAMGAQALRRHCELELSAQALLDSAFDKLGLSARTVTRILKVARTLADLDGCRRLSAANVAEAIQYRSLDARKSG